VALFIIIENPGWVTWGSFGGVFIRFHSNRGASKDDVGMNGNETNWLYSFLPCSSPVKLIAAKTKLSKPTTK
jgi:hypothetical protein